MDKSGRIAGMLVFALGIVIMLFVFKAAYNMFTLPAGDMLSISAKPGLPSGAAGLGSAVAWIVVRIALLFIMTLAGSMIAGKGIHLYLGCTERKSFWPEIRLLPAREGKAVAAHRSKTTSTEN